MKKNLKRVGIAATALALAAIGVSAQADDADRAEPTSRPATLVPPAPSGKVLWAVVDANGALSKGYRVASSTRWAVGTYKVRFNRDVQRCAYQATLQMRSALGYTRAGLHPDAPQTVRVYTEDANLTPADRGFHLTVTC
jgi:hypothetical protein